MADDNVVTESVTTPGATFATDDIGGVHYPRTKLVHGADGTNDGDVATGNPLPVEVRTPNGDSAMDDTADAMKATLVDSSGATVMDATADAVRVRPVDGAGDSLAEDAANALRCTVVDAAGDSCMDGAANALRVVGSGSFTTAPAFRANVTASGTISVGTPLAIDCDGADAIAWEIDTGLTNVTFEATIDGSTWFSIDAILLGGTVVTSVTSAPNRGFFETVGYDQVRLKANGGSGAARLIKTDSPAVIRTFAAARAALTSDSMSNPTVEQIAAHLMGHDVSGSTWSRVKVADNGYLIVQGRDPSGAAMSARPVPMAWRAVNGQPSAVDSLDAVYAWGDLRGRLITKAHAETATVTSVADNAASVQLLASNSARVGATIANDSSADLYVKLGTTASLTDYTVRIPQYGYFEVPYGYTGRIDGIWATDPGDGAARISELT